RKRDRPREHARSARAPGPYEMTRKTSEQIASLVAMAAALLPPFGASAQQSETVGGDRVLRVCEDPNNLPFSNRAGEGFENKIAELLARELGWTLEYTWFPQRMGFIRNRSEEHTSELQSRS